MKRCSKCKVEKSLEEFHKKGQTGRGSYCKPCASAYDTSERTKLARKAHDNLPENLIKEKNRQAERRRKPEVQEYHRAYQRDPRNRSRARLNLLMAKFGLSVVDYERMLETQGGTCALCPATRFDVRWERLAVDHCHKTGKVRQLLCGRCNMLLGNSGDDPSLLERMALYLRNHSEAA